MEGVARSVQVLVPGLVVAVALLKILRMLMLRVVLNWSLFGGWCRRACLMTWTAV